VWGEGKSNEGMRVDMREVDGRRENEEDDSERQEEERVVMKGGWECKKKTKQRTENVNK
jgi:hypothetical protein